MCPVLSNIADGVDGKRLNYFLRRDKMADEETNKLVDEVESEEVKEEKPEEEKPTEEVTADPEPVSDEIAKPPSEDVSDVQSIEELIALVKQLQAQVDALTSINTQEEPAPEPQAEQQPESQSEQPEEDPEEIEKLLDL